MLCPRRLENLDTVGEDHWRPDHSCSYCGSLSPALLMLRLEAGTIELGPTDKDYKAYVYNHGGEILGPIKFYYVHLNEAQMLRFIQLMNEDRLYTRGRFNPLPFFVKPK